jgi:hypothetical protein
MENDLWEAPRPTRSRCFKCGAEAPVRIQVIASRVTKGGKPKQGTMKARSARVCEEHAQELLGQIGDLLP